MKIFDTIYYAIYRFGRSLGQPDGQADATASIFMPTFFYLVVFTLYFISMSQIDRNMLPTKGFKQIFLGLAAVTFIASSVIYGKRRKRVLSEYGRLKNQKIYVWLGAIFSIVTISLPIWVWFLLRAIL
jgi:hypothetical protein